MIKLEKVNKYFNRHKKNELHVIDNTSTTFEDNGLVCLLGPSGCGKTTLLNVIGGLDKVKSGSIFVNGKRVTRKSTYYVDKERNLNIGYIFQNYNLLENLSVFENVAISLKMIGIKNKNEIQKRVNDILETLKIYRYRNRPAGMLSGGEKQRVAIARALVKNPSIILADEPTGNLDSQNTIEIMNIIKSISKNRLVILVTHETDIAKFYADRIIELSDGKIVNDYENKHENSLDYKIDNKIYLKDFKFKEENNSINIYADDKIKSKITLVVKNNNIYIKTEGNERIIAVDENSSVEFINDHYKQIDKSIYEKYEFDIKENKNEKHKYSSIFNIFKVVHLGFKKILDYSFIKKLLLLGFFASGAFIMYSVSNIFGLLNVKDSYFIEKNKNYLEAKIPVINVDNFNKYVSYESIDYILPGSGVAKFKINFDDYYQTSESSALITGGLVKKEYVSNNDIIYGSNISNDNDVVVDSSVLDSLFTSDERFAIQTGHKDLNDLIGYELQLKNMTFIIKGITDKGDHSIYMDEKYIYDVLYLSSNIGYEVDDETASYLNYSFDTTLNIKKGRMPINDYEVVLNSSLEYDYPLNSKIDNKINDQKLTVVGYYEGSSQYHYVNENMIKYLLIAKEKNLTIMPKDEEKAISDLNKENLEVKNSYEVSKENYMESKKEAVNSGLIVSLIILAISFVEIYLMIRSSYLSRIKEIGIYRAIGTKKSDIYKMFSSEIFAITTIAGLPGIVFMAYILYNLSKIKYISGMFLINVNIIIITIVCTYLFNLIIGLFPVFNVLKKRPAGILSRHDL